MNIQNEFDRLKSQFSLKDSDFYLLDLIPLIKIIWADGDNQDPELKILYKFVIEHMAYLDQQAGLHVINTVQANDFLDRFAHQKPSDELLNELQALNLIFLEQKNHPRHHTILEYCLDIAAACATQYPYQMHERIIQDEKTLLLKLFKELNIQVDLKR